MKRAAITLRPAELDDAEDIFRWRNDPITRAQSFTNDTITWSEHVQWFERTLQRQDRVLLLGLAEGRKIGVVRFDMHQPEAAEININLAPENRGQGYGAELIAASCRRLFLLFPSVRRVDARIKPDNQASLHAFAKAGFLPFTESEFKTLVLHASAPPLSSGRGEVIRQIMQFSSANLVVQAARFLKNFFLARMLGPGLFGLWNGLQVILVYGANAHLGALHAMNREVPQRRGRGESAAIPDLIRVSLTFTMLTTAIVAGILFALGLSSWFDAVTASALRLLALVLLAQQLYQFFHFWFRADEKFALLSKVLIWATLLELLLTLALVRVLGFQGIFYGFLGSSIVAALSCFAAAPVSLRRPLFDASIILALIRTGFPIMIIGLSYSLMTTLDRLLIINFLGEEQLGYYALGTLALTAMAYIPTAINQVLYPKMGARFGATNNAETLAPLVEKPTFATAVVMAAVLGAAFLALPLTPLLLPQYTEGIPTARILFVGFYFLSLVGGSANLLITINRQTQYLLSLLFAIVFGLLLNALALVLRLGIEGIAATTGIMYLLYAFGMVGFTARRYLRRKPLQVLAHCAKLMLPFLVAAFLLFSTTQITLPNLELTTFVRLLLFALLYLAFGYFGLRREVQEWA